MLQIPTVPLKGRLLTVDEVSQLLGAPDIEAKVESFPHLRLPLYA